MAESRMIIEVAYEVVDSVALRATQLTTIRDSETGPASPYVESRDESAVAFIVGQAIGETLMKTPGVRLGGSSVIHRPPDPDGSIPEITMPRLPAPGTEWRAAPWPDLQRTENRPVREEVPRTGLFVRSKSGLAISLWLPADVPVERADRGQLDNQMGGDVWCLAGGVRDANGEGGHYQLCRWRAVDPGL
jgi:hypothetical protein